MMGVEVRRETLLECLAVPRWADEVLSGQPYDDEQAVLAAADAAARGLTDAELDQALSGHPRIGERGGAHSTREQSGVDASAGDVTARLAAGNAAYEQRFDRVFLIRAAGRDAEQILAELDRRLRNDDAAERAETVDNLREIALLRLENALSGERPASTLSTHVLDTAAGRPAAGIAVRLESRDGQVLDEARTDADGRVGRLGPDRLDAGDYVIRFDTGAYVDGFYPEVVVVFRVADPDEHYHVPLLLSPFGYSTYRGS